MKNKAVTILIIIAVLALAGVAIFTALRLFAARRQAVAPTAPESRPGAQANVLYSYCSSWGCFRNPDGSAASAWITGKAGVSPSGYVSPQVVEADGTTQYTLMINHWHGYSSQTLVKDQRAWINHQGDNAASPRGILRWAVDRAVLEAIPNKKGDIISCVCSNGGQCEPGGGFAVIEGGAGSGSEYIKELISCESWSNSYSGTQGQDPANHVAQLHFTVEPKWAPDGPNEKNDVSTYAVNVSGGTFDWTNDDLNFIVPFIAECSDGVDNDSDNKIDCTAGGEDPGCYPSGYKKAGETCNPDDPSEKDQTPPQCSDGIDNDGDSKTDCTTGAEDPGCYPDGNGGGTCNPDDDNETDTPSGCALSFTISAATPTPTASPTPTATAKATATPTATPKATAAATPTPTATPVAQLPDAGVSTPTLLGFGIGAIILIFSLVLAL